MKIDVRLAMCFDE